MPRIDTFEFNDLAACPRVIRESIVESLGLGLRWGRILDGVGPIFAEFCARAHCDAVLDLCSGSGEPVSILLDALARQGLPAPRFVLSDLLPNLGAMRRVAARHAGLVEVVAEPLDATAVPEHHDRPARSIFNALHHLPAPLAARLIGDSVARRRALFVVEGFPRSLLRMGAALPAFLAAGAVIPLVSPRDRWLKALCTYASPLVAATGVWDAVASALRMHSEAELRAMAGAAPGYEWEYREVPFFPGGRATVFFGVPRG